MGRGAILSAREVLRMIAGAADIHQVEPLGLSDLVAREQAPSP